MLRNTLFLISLCVNILIHSQNNCWCYEFRYEIIDSLKLEVADTSFFETAFEIKSQYKYIYDEPFIIILPGKLDNGKFFEITLPMKLNIHSMDTIIFNLNNHIYYNKSKNEFFQTCFNNKKQTEQLIKIKKGGFVELINQVKIYHKKHIPAACVIPDLAIFKEKGMGQLLVETPSQKAKLMKYSPCDCFSTSLKQRIQNVFNQLNTNNEINIPCQPNNFIERQRMFKNLKIEEE